MIFVGDAYKVKPVCFNHSVRNIKTVDWELELVVATRTQTHTDTTEKSCKVSEIVLFFSALRINNKILLEGPGYVYNQ